MKIEFRKIALEPKNFALNLKDSDFDIQIKGKILRTSDDLVKIDSQMSGTIQLVCDRSGEEFIKDLDLHLVLFAKNGKWSDTNHKSHKSRYESLGDSLIESNDFSESDDENLAVIEIFDNFVDLDSIFLGEIESIRLDYHTKD